MYMFVTMQAIPARCNPRVFSWNIVPKSRRHQDANERHRHWTLHCETTVTILWRLRSVLLSQLDFQDFLFFPTFLPLNL